MLLDTTKGRINTKHSNVEKKVPAIKKPPEGGFFIGPNRLTWKRRQQQLQQRQKQRHQQERQQLQKRQVLREQQQAQQEQRQEPVRA